MSSHFLDLFADFLEGFTRVIPIEADTGGTVLDPLRSRQGVESSS